MPSSCSCGAPLPDDARFCHRCGKPQWEQDAAFTSAPEPPRVTATAPPPAPVSGLSHVTLGNPLVLRTSLLVATLTAMIEMIPFVSLIAPILGGFFTVSLYQRRSGVGGFVGDGAKLGWLTAVFNAILLTILISATISFSGFNMDAVRDQMRHQAFSPEQLQMVNSPWFLAFIVLFGWLVLFAFSSLLHIAGGALGARFARQKTS